MTPFLKANRRATNYRNEARAGYFAFLIALTISSQTGTRPTEFGMEQFAIGANSKAPPRAESGKRLDALAEFENFGAKLTAFGVEFQRRSIRLILRSYRNKLLSAAKLSIWLERVRVILASLPALCDAVLT